MMNYKDYYQIMEVTKNASFDEIKQAYHRLARKYHPDISKEPLAESKIKEINEAYEILKDPQKRSIYNASFKVVLPYSYAWFVAKKNALRHTAAQRYAKKTAAKRAKIFGHTKTAKVPTHVRKPTIEDSRMKPIKKILFVLISLLLLVMIAVMVFFSNEQLNQWQDHQQIQKSIRQGDKVAISALEGSDTETQKQILQGEQVKKALVDFYIQHADRPILAQLETYDESVSSLILNDDQVYQTLKAYYFPQIAALIKEHHFDKALSLLERFKNKYPSNPELSVKYQEINNLKQQRLAEFTQQYMECLDQTQAPLLERTHCMAAARRKIENVGIEHSLPNDPNLPAMYTEELKHALAEKNYQYAEQVLLDWQNLQPAANQQRQALREKLTLHRQVENIITDLTGTNQDQIVKRLTQLKADKALQNEILNRPDVKKNLLQYHLNEALILVTTNQGQVDIDPRTALRLEQILTAARDGITTPGLVQSTPWYNDSTELPKPNNNPVASLLQECQEHYEANRLTTGQPGTALACYQTVLRQNPGNSQAKKGLKAIENRYRRWAERAIQQNRLDAAEKYLERLQRVNPNSRSLRKLTQRLNAAKIPTSLPASEVNQPSKPKSPESEPQPMTCDDCNCSELLKQMSIGIKPLTAAQQNYFQTQCR